jgi:hypothetical protein
VRESFRIVALFLTVCRTSSRPDEKHEIVLLPLLFRSRLGRLVNHSIENANLKAKVFDHKGEPRILFFAIKDINPGDELLYDYGERRPEVVKDFPWLAL